MKLSAHEYDTKTLTAETLDTALQQIKMNGYTVFESVLSQDLVDELRARYMELLNANIAENAPQSRGKAVADASAVRAAVQPSGRGK